MRLTVNSKEVSTETVSGSMILRGRMNGSVSAEAVSGNIDMQVNASVQKVSANTVSGAIKVDTALADGGQIDVESVSGWLARVLPWDLSARVWGQGMSGRLRAPEATIDKPRYVPGCSFTTRYGSGNGDIRLATLSGNAELQLKQAARSRATLTRRADLARIACVTRAPPCATGATATSRIRVIAARGNSGVHPRA